MWVVVLGGCLEKNPIYVDPTDTDSEDTRTTYTEASSPFPMGGTTDTPDTLPNDPTDSPPTTTSTPASTTTSTQETDGPVQETTGATEPVDPPGSTGSSATSESSTTTGAVGVCGDKVVDGEEECDDGNDASNDECTIKCKLAKCSDGIVQPLEQCDDANTMADDMCQNDCTWTRKVVFVTSKGFTGAQIGGLAGADAHCNFAAKGKLPGIYQAWLSDKNWWPDKRMAKHPFQYVRSDGELIALGWEELASTMHTLPIDRAEDGGPPFQTDTLCENRGIHTNTDEHGFSAGIDGDCMGWDSDQGFTTWGSTQNPNKWSKACGGLCGQEAPLLCVQQ